MPYLHTCEVCNKTCDQEGSLNSHCLTDTNRKIYSSEVQSKEFALKPLEKQCYKTPKKERTDNLDVCNKAFSQKCVLSSLEGTLTNGKPYSCRVCRKDFVQKSSLNRHYRKLHKNEIPISSNVQVCFIKNQSTEINLKPILESNANNHYYTYTNEKPYSCDVCCKSFSRKNDLNRHFQIHTTKKPFSCDVCHKSFRQKSHLNVHFLTHTNVKPFSCDVCNREFSLKSTLQAHFRTHTKEKPYGCDVCNRKFANKSSISVHYRTHTNEKPYSCDVCNRRFSSKGSFNKHQRTHKKEKPYSSTLKAGLIKRGFVKSNVKQVLVDPVC